MQSCLNQFHEARVQFLKKYGFSELDIGGASLIMADVAIVYRSEGFYGDVLVVEVTPDDFASRGFDLFYRLTNKATQQEVAHAKTGMLGFDYEKKRLCELPAKFLSSFVP